MDKEATGFKSNGHDQAKTWIKAAYILRTTVEALPELKKRILDVEGTEILYQKLSSGRLTVIEEFSQNGNSGE